MACPTKEPIDRPERWRSQDVVWDGAIPPLRSLGGAQGHQDVHRGQSHLYRSPPPSDYRSLRVLTLKQAGAQPTAQRTKSLEPSLPLLIPRLRVPT